MTGIVPIHLDKSVKKKDRDDAVHRIARQVREVYSECQSTPGMAGHIRLGWLQLDANSLTAFKLVPQKLTLIGWRDMK